MACIYNDRRLSILSIRAIETWRVTGLPQQRCDADRPTVAAVKGRAASFISGTLPLELSTEDSLPQNCHMARALEEANHTFKVNASAIEQSTHSEWKSVPCYGLPAELAEQIATKFSPSVKAPQFPSLDDLFALYNRSNPITAWTVPVFFTVRSVWNLLLADLFFQFVQKKRALIKEVRCASRFIHASYYMMRG